ncbi:hypothetical protein [Paenibacillus dendritiformis]|uniref:hypothetical protein n=1 Tax=Paenibacillus dendritiformis TaxID=130049 RepID=UPI000DA742D2|nr:hypothetical protein [Paenibacillus dendritiformis]PZM64853.1 hypothetical protein DOE73_14940 [Paenibacillus dendritiformis]
MIKLAKDTIEDILKAGGVKSIFREEEGLDRSRKSPSVIILAAPEKLVPDRQKAAKFQQGIRRFLRSKRFKRVMPIEVGIFDRSEEEVDRWIQLLLRELPDGIDDGQGNYTAIRPSTIEWVADSSNRAAANLTIEFDFGIYVDRELGRIEDVHLKSITVEANQHDG